MMIPDEPMAGLLGWRPGIPELIEPKTSGLKSDSYYIVLGCQMLSRVISARQRRVAVPRTDGLCRLSRPQPSTFGAPRQADVLDLCRRPTRTGTREPADS